MRKGDTRRAEILQTAERLFFENGYENTSIQDILDQMQLSKGGFYHHFESKSQLLEAVCAQRAELACARGAQAMVAAGDNPIDQLNALFQRGGFFGEESIGYVFLMIKTAYRGELSQLRERVRKTMLEQYTPLLKQIIFGGIDKQVFYCAHPERIARLIVMLANDVTDEVAAIAAKPKEEMGDMADMMDLLSVYRNSVELLLNAPYGSIDLISVNRLRDVLRSLISQGMRAPLPGTLTI